ncbi:MAG: hypothetical protein NZT61_00745 [Deltaproteobacteria bacterium]|nr:hypothetical protein [Deltaproteobacteria bacterium]MCX7952958.1 hypothetical protein [Deltaproteobacteria bacterium]
MDGKELNTLLSVVGQLSRLAVSSNESLAQSIKAVFKLFDQLDSVTDLPEEEMVYPTSSQIRIQEVFEPENIPQSCLLDQVPSKNGPFIECPLIVEDDS